MINIIHKEIDHPHFGEVVYDIAGNPICHICGNGYRKLLSHVWQKHDILSDEYKEMFGLEKGKGILNQETRDLLRQRVKENYEKVVTQNLIKNGTKSRFTSGGKGRTRDQVSEQTRRKLVKRITKATEHKGGKFYDKE